MKTFQLPFMQNEFPVSKLIKHDASPGIVLKESKEKTDSEGHFYPLKSSLSLGHLGTKTSVTRIKPSGFKKELDDFRNMWKGQC